MGSDRVPFTLRLPEDLMKAAQAAAEADGRSLNNWLEQLVKAATANTGKKASKR